MTRRKGTIVIMGALLLILMSACRLQQEGTLEHTGQVTVMPGPVPTVDVTEEQAEPQDEPTEELSESESSEEILGEITEAPAQPPVTEPAIPLDAGTRMVDLDGDGNVDELLVECVDADTFAGSRKFHITINGKDFFDEAMSQQFWENPCDTHYGLWRLNPEANWLAVGLYYEGPSNDPVTMFYKYREGILIYIGMVEGYPAQDSEGYFLQNVWLDEEGYLHTPMRLDILQTWWTMVSWKLDDEGNLAMVEQEVYEPMEGCEGPYPLISDLLIYEKPDKESGQKWMMAGQEVSITGTDNQNWCRVESADGVIGWFYVENYYKMVDVGLDAPEVFDGLCYAD